MSMDKRKYNCRWSFISSSFQSSCTFRISAATTFIFTIIILLLGLPSTSSTSSPSDKLQLPGLSIGRNLLQAMKECEVDVQGWNYSIVVNRCKGPRYPANICCEAFKEMACPYSDEINDVTNNCATTMFSYLNLYGNYPPGLFANICRDSRRGLECTETQKSQQVSRATSSAASISTTPSVNVIAFFSLTISYCLFLFLFL